MTPKERHAELNNVLIGQVTEAETRHRVDERGIQMPDWWDSDDTSESVALQNMLAMKSWKGGGQ